MTWRDDPDQYRHDQLSEFGLSARARGMKSAIDAQMYIITTTGHASAIASQPRSYMV